MGWQWKRSKMGGTSPRTRGKRHKPHRHMLTARNIPAHAGKTNYFGSVVAEMEEHPRARGENGERISRYTATGGTSPRTRGNPGFCACKTYTCGTSPRTRGKRVGVLHPAARCRNIPAHAGKTTIYAPTSTTYPEHPRARGENAWKPSKARPNPGTSPRTRGKLPALVRASGAWRNIPAHAGKTRTRRKIWSL